MKIRFWSSTEYAGFLAGLMREFTEAGFEAKQYYQISEASYRSAKSAPARVFLRFRQYLAYPLQMIAILVAQRFKGGVRLVQGDDACVVCTNTFYAPLIASYLHPNVVHLVYDLFPEAMIHSGKWTEGTFKVRIVRWITKQTLKRAKTNVFLGKRLMDYVESIHGQVENAAIIPIGADQALFSKNPVERRSLNPQSSPTILYCGNFGNMHDSVTLFDYWKRSDEHGGSLQWVFQCSGPKLGELESVLSELPVSVKQQIHLGGGLDQAAWVATMESAAVALVTMVPGSETVVMPSKTYSAMMAGQAILAIAPDDSDLVDLIKTADCGWFVKPGDIDGLARVVEAIYTDPEGLLEKRQNAYLYAQAHLGQDTLVNDWMTTLRYTATEYFQP
jgi:glycosyltransferase involved in cell wall biosynthesis